MLAGSRLPLAAGLVALAVTVVGVAVQASGADLGTALAPYVMGFPPRLEAAWAILAVAGCVLALVVAPPRLLGLRSPLAFGLGLVALTLLVALPLNAARIGPQAWANVFDISARGSFTAQNEILPGLPALQWGLAPFLDRFAEVGPAVPVNVIGHPPGQMVILHVLGIQTPAQLAALVIGVGMATGPLCWLLGRELLVDEASARRAGLLAALSPGLLLFGVTSVDYLYAASGTLAAWLLLRRPLVAGGLAFAVAALLHWALLAVGAWAAVVVLLRDGWRVALQLALVCAIWVLASQALLAATTGYDPLGTLASTEAVYRQSLARDRPSWFWVLGSPVAWGVMSGLALLAWALVALGRRAPAAVGLAVIIGVAAVMGFTKAETERIWLFMVPLAAVAAAAALPAGRLRPALGLGLAQALVVQALFMTVW